jgi:hypothetical protein
MVRRAKNQETECWHGLTRDWTAASDSPGAFDVSERMHSLCHPVILNGLGPDTIRRPRWALPARGTGRATLGRPSVPWPVSDIPRRSIAIDASPHPTNPHISWHSAPQGRAGSQWGRVRSGAESGCPWLCSRDVAAGCWRTSIAAIKKSVSVPKKHSRSGLDVVISQANP